jgi:hypothetical protein
MLAILAIFLFISGCTVNVGRIPDFMCFMTQVPTGQMLIECGDYPSWEAWQEKQQQPQANLTF